MTTKLKHILLIAYCLLLIGISGCEKKYEEGPLISFRSLEKRLVGKWKLEKYTVDGIDSTNYLQSASCDYFLNIESAYKAGRWSGESNSGSASMCYNIGSQHIEQQYDFEYSNKRIQILSSETTADDNGPIGFQGCRQNSSGELYCVPMNWDFLKVTNKKLIIKLYDAGSEVFFIAGSIV